MLHFLIKGNFEEVKYPTQSMFIQDVNALFHSLSGFCTHLWGYIATDVESNGLKLKLHILYWFTP